MDPDRRALFISLRPRFAELLLAGRKTVELRRVQPDIAPGAVALLYASSPVRALLGVAVVDQVQVAKSAEIWRVYGERTGITLEEYEHYFNGAATAVAITLGEVRRLRTPITLAELREGCTWFRPPQSFRYLDAEQTASLVLAGGDTPHKLPSAHGLGWPDPEQPTRASDLMVGARVVAVDGSHARR
jgi:predicted transcriptional regulator